MGRARSDVYEYCARMPLWFLVSSLAASRVGDHRFYLDSPPALALFSRGGPGRRTPRAIAAP
jgi:hypothetical protein